MDRLNVLSIGLTSHSIDGKDTVEFHDLFLHLQSADDKGQRFVSIPVREVEKLIAKAKKAKLEDNKVIHL